jgi:hypothetical protein
MQPLVIYSTLCAVLNTLIHMYSITLDPIKILHTDRYSTWHFRCHPIPADIVGMEVEIRSHKRGRVEDHQIQLQIGDEPIGDNRAVANTGNTHRYGSPTDTWGARITFADINRLNVLTQYLCSVVEPVGTVTVDTVLMHIHYRPRSSN